MRRLRQELKWWGLYALLPLTVVLIVLDEDASLPPTWRLILLAGIVVMICLLALRWIERNSELVEREGADGAVSTRPLLITNASGGAEPVVHGSHLAHGRKWMDRRDGQPVQSASFGEPIEAECVP